MHCLLNTYLDLIVPLLALFPALFTALTFIVTQHSGICKFTSLHCSLAPFMMSAETRQVN